MTEKIITTQTKIDADGDKCGAECIDKNTKRGSDDYRKCFIHQKAIKYSPGDYIPVKWLRCQACLDAEHSAKGKKIEDKFLTDSIIELGSKLDAKDAVIDELVGALDGVLQSAVILSEEYLSGFYDKPDDAVIQGWEKARWKRAIVSKKAADQALENAKEVRG